MANINEELENKANSSAADADKQAVARPKKKSSIAAVFNPQYSKQGRRPDGKNGRNDGPRKDGQSRDGQNRNGQNRNDQNRNDRNQQQKRATGNGASAQQAKIIKPRPVGERALRPIGERTPKEEIIMKKPEAPAPVKEAPVKEIPAVKEAPVKEAPAKEAAAPGKDAPARETAAPAKEAPVREAAGERAPRGDRQDRPVRNQGDRQDRPARNQGDRQDRPARNQGDRQDRPARNQGDRPNFRSDRGEGRPQGDRPNFRNDRGEGRPQGDRPNFRNDRGEGRPQGDRSNFRNDRGEGRPQGDRPNFRNDRGEGRPQGDRPNNRFGDNKGEKRFGDRSNNGGRFNKEAAAPAAEEVRGKESRERTNDNRKKNNAHSDRDKLGKKQENYINLEKHGGKKRPQQPQQPKEDPDEIKTLVLPEKMTLKELADAMKQQPSVLIKNLFMKGEMCTMNSEITYEKAEELAMDFNYVCEPEEKIDVIAELLKESEEDEETMVKRPPVVCVMGHVDHGKTSLLDAIRSTRVTAREAGGITQHIGASVVSINNEKITFLDTPGHEAFTAMRMRGAKSTDIAILVVAADDGVMPQTIEAINHAKAAGVEIIVAVNKIDKPAANVERVKQEMTEYGLVAEDWGGSTIFCPVSAKTHEGIDELLEMVLLTADVLELKANPKRNARGLVIEAQLDKGRGSVATVLVQKGTLHVGDCVACGSSYGKVRAMIDDKGRRVKEATPSTPVEILGLNSVPAAGETFVVCDNEKEAKAFADTYITEEKNRLLEETKQKLSLESLFSQIQAGNVKELNLIVKADVQGSVEAVKSSLMKLSNEEVVVKVIHGGVGAITESDVILGSASNAIIIGFNVRPDAVAKATAERENVEIRLYNVIYQAIEEIERKMKGMKDPVYEEKILGHAEIRMIFKASGVGNIAGSYVMDGIIERGCKIRISREGKQIWEGDLASLKRFKDDVKEVKTNYECGLVFDGFNDIQEFDIVEAYKMVEVKED